MSSPGSSSKSSKRSSYTLEFKIGVIMEYEKTLNKSAVAVKFGINRRQVLDWVNNKDRVMSSAKHFHQDRRRLLRYNADLMEAGSSGSGSRGVGKFPELEQQLTEWRAEQRAMKKCVQLKDIQRKASELHAGNDEPFHASKGWLYRFMRRSNICNRQATGTSVRQKVPSSAPLLSQMFMQEVKSTIRKQGVELNGIYNMDEAPCYFDLPTGHTVDIKGAQDVAVATTGYEKLRFTSVLAMSAAGKKLPVMIIFKGLKNIPKLKADEEWPENVCVQVSHGGTMTSELLQTWCEEVYSKRPGGTRCFSPSSVLVLDKATCHKADVITRAVNNTSVVFVPRGCTPILQPLDVSIKKAFKEKLSHYWGEWMNSPQAEKSLTKSGKRKRASYFEVAKWISLAWREINVETIVKSFEVTGITAGDHLNYKLQKILDSAKTEDVAEFDESGDDDERVCLTDDDDGLIEDVEQEEQTQVNLSSVKIEPKQ